MKRWKIVVLVVLLLGGGAGLAVWRFRPQVETHSARALALGSTAYVKLASRFDLPVPTAVMERADGHAPQAGAGNIMQASSEGQGEHASHGAMPTPSGTGHEGHGAAMPAQSGSGHEGHGAATPAQGGMPSMGPGGVMLSEEKQQLMGVRVGKVERRPLVKVIRTVGTVEADETRIAHVHTKIKGWIDELAVDFTGQLVEEGQLLFTLYSPELVATQEEYLLALRAQSYLGDSPFREVSEGGRTVLEATRRRLKLWDINDEQIAELEQTGKPKINLEFYSPISGYVTEKMALKGMAVSPGMSLYTITDLSKVWLLADIYEQELSLVKLDQEAQVTIASYPGEVFTGKVIYIYPYLESATRTVKIRLELDNSDAKLKPKMFANVMIKVDLGEQLAVPDGAILDSGSRQIAFVAKGGGHFEPREVTLGPKVDDHFVVLNGLKEGESIATSATFLIDSESQLKSAVGGMGGHSGH